MPAQKNPTGWDQFVAALSVVDWGRKLRDLDTAEVKRGARTRAPNILAGLAIQRACLMQPLEAYEAARGMTRDELIETLSHAIQSAGRRERSEGYNRARRQDMSVVYQAYVQARLARFRDRATARQLREVA